jgi:hypothetical protein
MRKKSGSLSTEAALTFPVFIVMIIFIIFAGKIVYTHEKMQYALDETSSELASYSYLYYVTGVSSFEENNTTDSTLLDTTINSAGEILRTGDFNVNYFTEEIKNIFITSISQNLKNEIIIPIIKSNIKKHLNINDSDGTDLERNYYIINSFEGIDFSKTSVLNGGTGDIKIQADYYVEFPIFSSVLPRFRLQNISVQKPWLGGDKTLNNVENIWSLPPFERGKKLQTIMGENLPDSLPVSILESDGTAIRITSIDISLPYASTKKYIEENVTGHIISLKNFNGCSTPNFEIQPQSISHRKLIVVIPENTATNEINNVFDNLKSIALSNGITLEIKPYGNKNS